MSVFEFQLKAAAGEEREFEHELAVAALELEGVPGNALLPEGETGLGAARALDHMVALLSQSGGLTTQEQQQLALALALKQVDASGHAVGRTLNKPDISYVAEGRGGALQRVNIEIESDKPFQHLRQVRRGRGADATNVFVKVHPWTGQIEQAWILAPEQKGRPTMMTSAQMQNLQRTLPRPVRDPSLRIDRRGKQERLPASNLPPARGRAIRPSTARPRPAARRGTPAGRTARGRLRESESEAEWEFEAAAAALGSELAMRRF